MADAFEDQIKLYKKNKVLGLSIGNKSLKKEDIIKSKLKDGETVFVKMENAIKINIACQNGFYAPFSKDQRNLAAIFDLIDFDKVC